MIDVDDHGRTDPATAAAMNLDETATQHARAALQCVVDLLGNDVGLPVENQRCLTALKEILA